MFSSWKFSLFSVNLFCKRFAGHSKWQNIRHTKAAKDAERSQLFIRLGQRIKIAIQESGSNDPLCNNKLQQAIEVAKSKHMPSNTIQSYINQAKKSTEAAKLYYYDIKGPKGSFFIIETYTDNSVKSRNNIQSVIKKTSLTLDNNLRSNFIRKGIVVAKASSKIQTNNELAVEHAIEAGAEDVQCNEEDGSFEFTCDPHAVKNVSDKLKEIGYEIEDADEHLFPLHRVILDDVYLETLGKTIEKINNLPEVVKIYDNVA